MNRSRAIFQDLFERDLRLLGNPICAQCDAVVRHPLLPWVVGDRFSTTAERIMFIGKPHRGRPQRPDDVLPSGVVDSTVTVTDSLWDWHTPYWSYTREIAERLYGDNACESICMTNLVKCTNVNDDDLARDKTTRVMAESCVSRLGVIWREVEKLEARSLVFYTYHLFRDTLRRIPIALPGSVRELTPFDYTVECRNKPLGWWERACKTAWTDNLRLLVVGHPERMGRPEFVELLTNWLRTP